MEQDKIYKYWALTNAKLFTPKEFYEHFKLDFYDLQKKSRKECADAWQWYLDARKTDGRRSKKPAANAPAKFSKWKVVNFPCRYSDIGMNELGKKSNKNGVIVGESSSAYKVIWNGSMSAHEYAKEFIEGVLA